MCGMRPQRRPQSFEFGVVGGRCAFVAASTRHLDAGCPQRRRQITPATSGTASGCRGRRMLPSTCGGLTKSRASILPHHASSTSTRGFWIGGVGGRLQDHGQTTMAAALQTDT